MLEASVLDPSIAAGLLLLCGLVILLLGVELLLRRRWRKQARRGFAKKLLAQSGPPAQREKPPGPAQAEPLKRRGVRRELRFYR